MASIAADEKLVPDVQVSKPTRRLVLGSLGVLALAVITILIDPSLGEYLGMPLMLVGYTIAGVLFTRGSTRYHGRERLAWSLIGTAYLLGAAGVLSFLVAYFAVGDNIPAFGPLDICFILAYLTNLAGLWVLPHMQGAPVRRARVFIDGMVGAVSIILIAWVWFLHDILDRMNDATPLELVIGYAYPLIDVATIVVVMMVTLRRSTLRFDPRVLLIGAGYVAQSIADLLYLHRGLGGSFGDAQPVYELFFLGIMAFLIAGLNVHHRPPAREYAERNTPWWAMLAPYGGAVALTGMLLFRLVNLVDSSDAYQSETLQLFIGAMVVVGLIIVRQALAIRETRELVERQRTALVSSISHELRTPLTAMVGFLDILADPDQEIDIPARREMIGIVNQQATYMARIVSDLVMLNRQDPDIKLQRRLVDVESVVQTAVASLDLDTGPGVRTEVEPGLVGFFDPNRIQQVLVNMFTNAARYGGPNRLLVARRAARGVEFELHDDGPGVPKRYELVIWDRFERGAQRYNAGAPGSGIGLAIVEMLVRAHGGSVGYRRSERLGGACFTFSVPSHPEAATPRVRAQPDFATVSRTEP